MTNGPAIVQKAITAGDDAVLSMLYVSSAGVLSVLLQSNGVPRKAAEAVSGDDPGKKSPLAIIIVDEAG